MPFGLSHIARPGNGHLNQFLASGTESFCSILSILLKVFFQSQDITYYAGALVPHRHLIHGLHSVSADQAQCVVGEGAEVGHQEHQLPPVVPCHAEKNASKDICHQWNLS